MRYLIVILTLLAALMLAAGCMETTNLATETSSKVELGEWHSSAEGGYYGPPIYHVRGDLKNIAGKKLNYVSIKANLYGRDGALVGNGVDFVQNLGAGETWRFDIVYSGYAHRVTLDEVVAY